MRAEVFPLEKIKFDDKEILLGMKADKVQELLGKPDSIFQNYGGDSYRHFYFNSELGLDFDKDGKLEFIEFLAGIEGILRPYIYGISVFETDADELIGIITEHDREVDDSEAGFCYSFLTVSIGLWRENDEEKHWDTIGIGMRDYYKYE